MELDDKVRDEKLKDHFNRDTAKLLALSSGKIDEYEYTTGEGILPFNQRKIIEHILLFVCIFFFRKSFGETEKKDWSSSRK